MLLLADLLAETLTTSGAARMQGISAAVDPRKLGHALAQDLAAHLRGIPAADLADVLTAGMTSTSCRSAPVPRPRRWSG